MSEQPTKKPGAGKQVLVIGATSNIARAVAQRLGERGYALVLAARNIDAAESDAADLRTRHNIDVQTRPFQALEYPSHADLVEGLDLYAAVICYGTLLTNEDAIACFPDHHNMIDVNYTSCASVLEVLASYFEAKGAGVIATISSVAGDRGRSRNYCYGATKAALSAYLSGLRARLYPKGVAVLTIKPGPTDTPMLDGHKAQGPTASPQMVAKCIVQDIERRRSICYAPRKWWPIMTIIRAIPEWVFKRTSF